jgi:hypothetical protein
MSDREAELEARIEELERKAKPPKSLKELVAEAGPSGPTTTQIALNNLRMSKEVMADHVRAVSGVTVRELVGDGGAAATLKPLSDGNARPTVAQQNRSGWRNPAPLTNPPGVSLADKIMDAADVADRGELAQRLARQKLAEGK